MPPQKHTFVFKHKLYAQAAHIFKNMHTLGVTKTHYRRKRSCYFQELFIHVTATTGWLWGALPCLLTLPTLFGCDWCAGSTAALLRQWLIPCKVEKVQVGRKQVGSWMKGDKYNLHVYQKGRQIQFTCVPKRTITLAPVSRKQVGPWMKTDERQIQFTCIPKITITLSPFLFLPSA